MGDKACAYISIRKKDWEENEDLYKQCRTFTSGEVAEIEKGVVQLVWEDCWPEMWASIRCIAGNRIASYGWLEDSGNDTNQQVCTIAGKSYCFDSLNEAPAIMVGEKDTIRDFRKARQFIERFEKAKKLVERK
jgi:hypothetical protein